MRLRFCSVVLGGFFMATVGLAQTEKAPVNTTPEDSLSPSAQVRAAKKFGIGAGMGSFVFPVNGAGLSLHYNLSPGVQIEGGFFSGTWDAKDLLTLETAIFLDKFDVNSTLNYVGVKIFPGNSFYVAGGLGSRKIEFDLAAHSGSDSIQEKLEASSGVARFAIGNIWSFDSGFYIGGEWLSLAIPISSSVTTDITTTGSSTASIGDLEKDAVEVADTLSKATTIGIMMHLGFQF